MSSLLIKLLTFFVGLYFVLEFVLPDPFLGISLGSYSQLILQVITGTGVISLGLGLISVLGIHGGRVVRASRGWSYSAALLVSLFAMVFLQSVDWYRSAVNADRVEKLANLAEFAGVVRSEFDSGAATNIGERNQALVGALASVASDFRPSANLAAAFGKIDPSDIEAQRQMNQALEAELRSSIPELQQRLEAEYRDSNWKRAFSLFYDGLFIPLGAAMFGLLGFYIAAAAYRAFRVRSVESSLMMLAAVLVILGQTPFGTLLWDGFSGVRSWLLEVPSKGAFRAIRIGAAVASLVLAFRIWCSIESRSISGGSRE